MKAINDHRSEFPMKAIGIKKPEKIQGFNGIRTRDLRDTSAMLHHLSYEATHWDRGCCCRAMSWFAVFQVRKAGVLNRTKCRCLRELRQGNIADFLSKLF